MERVIGANIAADSLSSRGNILWFKDEEGGCDLVTNKKYCYLKMFQNPVGAAEGCDLLALFLKDKIKRSQPSAAPTGEWWA
jgi:hypothetical protein